MGDGWSGVVERVDRAVDQCTRGSLIPSEAVLRMAEAFADLVDGAPGQEVLEFVADYVLEAGERIAERTHDRGLVVALEDRIAFAFRRPDVAALVDNLLGGLEVGLALGDPGAAATLVELCRDGRPRMRSVFSLATTAGRVLDLAHRYRCVEALAVAVRPATGRSRLAHDEWYRADFVRAMNHLAHLAAEAEGEAGVDARAVLVELTGDLEVAGSAAVRLPAHLLDDQQRRELLAHLESRQDLFDADDPIVVPPSVGYSRDTETLRTAAWQAMDATRVL